MAFLAGFNNAGKMPGSGPVLTDPEAMRGVSEYSKLPNPGAGPYVGVGAPPRPRVDSILREQEEQRRQQAEQRRQQEEQLGKQQEQQRQEQLRQQQEEQLRKQQEQQRQEQRRQQEEQLRKQQEQQRQQQEEQLRRQQEQQRQEQLRQQEEQRRQQEQLQQQPQEIPFSKLDDPYQITLHGNTLLIENISGEAFEGLISFYYVSGGELHLKNLEISVGEKNSKPIEIDTYKNNINNIMKISLLGSNKNIEFSGYRNNESLSEEGKKLFKDFENLRKLDTPESQDVFMSLIDLDNELFDEKFTKEKLNEISRPFTDFLKVNNKNRFANLYYSALLNYNTNKRDCVKELDNFVKLIESIPDNPNFENIKVYKDNVINNLYKQIDFVSGASYYAGTDLEKGIIVNNNTELPFNGSIIIKQTDQVIILENKKIDQKSESTIDLSNNNNYDESKVLFIIFKNEFGYIVYVRYVEPKIKGKHEPTILGRAEVPLNYILKHINKALLIVLIILLIFIVYLQCTDKQIYEIIP
jgi:hypothetical protein